MKCLQEGSDAFARIFLFAFLSLGLRVYAVNTYWWQYCCGIMYICDSFNFVV